MSQLDGITGPMWESCGLSPACPQPHGVTSHRSLCLLFVPYTIWVDGRASNLYSLFSELTTCPEGYPGALKENSSLWQERPVTGDSSRILRSLFLSDLISSLSPMPAKFPLGSLVILSNKNSGWGIGGGE